VITSEAIHDIPDWGLSTPEIINGNKDSRKLNLIEYSNIYPYYACVVLFTALSCRALAASIAVELHSLFSYVYSLPLMYVMAIVVAWFLHEDRLGRKQFVC
jgi:hypothetical protein